jgi:hypothetical protein
VKLKQTAKGVRIIVDPGDSPWTIARDMVGQPLRWPELVAANPGKKTTPAGSFVSLVPGEELYVPASWLAHARPAPDAGAMTPSPGSSVVTPRKWAVALLARLGAPITEENISSIVAWVAFEGGHWNNSAKYNPLNTTRKYGASHAWGGAVPIQVYTSWIEGLEATALTIEQKNMASIRDALLRSAAPEETLYAIKTSPWGTTALDPNSWRSLASSAWMNKPDPYGESDQQLASYIEQRRAQGPFSFASFSPDKGSGGIGGALLVLLLAAGAYLVATGHTERSL